MRAIYHQHAALHALGASVFTALATIMFLMAGQNPVHKTADTVAAWVFVCIAFGHAVLCFVNYARSRRH